MLLGIIALVAASSPIKLHGCLTPAAQGLPFCNPKLSAGARARDLRTRLSLHEKVCMLNANPQNHKTDNCSGAVPRLGLPAYNWGIEDLHGAGIQCLNTTDGAGRARWHCPTIFPTLNVLAASFNETLWEAIGAVIGVEVRAANNAGASRARSPPGEAKGNAMVGVNAWGPNLNIARDPRWGRNDEVPSEDPFLAGKLGAGMVRGIQGLAAAPGRHGVAQEGQYVMTLAALKHVTAYSLEDWQDDTGGPRNGTKYSRMGFDATITRHDLAETYLEQFRIAIAEAHPLGMMCSYAGINGTASCENSHLLQTWARKSQGFAGNVVTDCGALKMPDEPADKVVSAAAALNAGADLDCGEVYSTSLMAAIAQNLTTEALVDTALERSVTLLMQAGYFDPLGSVKEASIPPAAVGTAASHTLAKDTALQGMVLLRNEVPAGASAPALPLRRGVQTAVIGPLANATLVMLARYYDAVCAGPLNASLPWGHGQRPSQCIESPLHRIMARGGGTVTHASGWDCPTDRPGDHCLESDSHAGFPQAMAAAAAADQVVVFVGLDQYAAKEGTDRQYLTLTGAQPDLLAAVRASTKPGVPVTVVVMNGGAVAVDYPAVGDAAIEAFFPGIEGAEAIACALYGEVGCNRFGRLPVTVLPATFAGNAGNDMANMGISTGGSGSRTYKYYEGQFGKPLFEFGFGLSYVPFSLAWASPNPATPSAISPTANQSIVVVAKNLGQREGDVVLLLYHHPRETVATLADLPADVPIPQRKLVGYARIGLLAGADAQVVFTVTAESLALVDNDGNTQLYAGMHQLRVSQGSGNDLSREFQVQQTAVLRTLDW